MALETQIAWKWSLLTKLLDLAEICSANFLFATNTPKKSSALKDSSLTK